MSPFYWKTDFYFYTSELTAAHISEIMVLCCKPPFGDYANQLWDQLVLLQHKVSEVNLQIDRQKFLIKSLETNVREGIITLTESEELRLTFESRQTELVKVRNQLLEKIQWIRDTTTSF